MEGTGTGTGVVRRDGACIMSILVPDVGAVTPLCAHALLDWGSRPCGYTQMRVAVVSRGHLRAHGMQRWIHGERSRGQAVPEHREGNHLPRHDGAAWDPNEGPTTR